MYSLLLAIIYLAFISLGLPDSLLGAGWPTIHAEMGVPISYMGMVTMLISASTIASSLLCDRVVARLGTYRITTISIGLTSLAMLGFSQAEEFWQLCLLAIPYGLGAGAIDASLNNYVATHYNSRHMSWLHCFWGVGTIVSPNVMSLALARSVWQDGYKAIGILQLCILFIVAISAPLWRAGGNKNDPATAVLPIGIRGAVKIKGALPVFIGFLAYCATESTAMLWTSSYFEGVFGMAKDKAAALGSIFFIGMTVGRFISGFIADRLGDSRMIRLGGVIALLGIILAALPFKSVAILGFIIIGLGCAPIYPSIVHSTPARFGAERSQSIIGIQMASAYLGSTLMPPLFGLIAENISLTLMPLYLAFFMIIMLLLLTYADRLTIKKGAVTFGKTEKVRNINKKVSNTKNRK